MSLQQSVKFLNELIAATSCPLCGQCYDHPELGSCSHRICQQCWKTKNKCQECCEDIDHEYLQEDVLMLKLASTVKNILKKVSKFGDFNEVKDDLSLGKGWLNDSEKTNTEKPTAEMAAITPLSGYNHVDQRVIKVTRQEDFDKIEYMLEESQKNIKDKENNVALNTEDFVIENSENAAPHRSMRNKRIISHETNIHQNTTEAVVEVHKSSKQNTPLGSHKSTKLSKQNNWKSIKKMKKEFSKLKKRDIKKLNVSIEMCKKTQSVISKQNISPNSNILNEEPIHIDENSQSEVPQNKITYPSENVLKSLSLPLVILENIHPNQSKLIQLPLENSTLKSDKVSESSSTNTNSAEYKQCSSEPRTDTAPTETCSDIQSPLLSIAIPKSDSANCDSSSNTKKSPDKLMANLNGENFNLIHNAKQTKVSLLRNQSRRVNNTSVSKKNSCRSTAKVHPCRQQKIQSKSLSSNRFNPLKRCHPKFEKNISIINITTPVGNFIISGQNISITKSIKSFEKAVQTDSQTLPDTQIIDIPNTFLNALEEPMNSQEKSVKDVQSQTTNIKNINITENFHKTNTASVDATSGPYKITESVEKELNNDMECVEDMDIFNTCSGEKVNCISKDIFNTEFINPTLKSQAQKIKCSIHTSQEPPLKKSKNFTISSPNANSKVKISNREEIKSNLNNYCDKLTHDFEEITNRAFAQIDADLNEGINKNCSREKCNNAIETDEIFFVNTPKSSQNQNNDIDSDSSVVEETPQKDKTLKQASINNTQTVLEPQKTINSCTTKQPCSIEEKRTNIEIESQNVDSPDTVAFSSGIREESTPLRTAPRRTLDFSKISRRETEHDSFSCQNNSAAEFTKTTLEKEFMEKAFEHSPKVARPKKEISLKKYARHVKIACSSVSIEQKMEVIRLAHVHKWEFFEAYTPSITHLIVSVIDGKAQRTVKYMKALAGGKWILSFDWIAACIQSNSIVDEEPYEALDTMGDPGPRLARLSQTKLFRGIVFHCLPPFNMPEQNILEEILESAGGTITANIDEVSFQKTSSVAIVLAEPQNTVDQRYTYLAIEKQVVPVNFEWAFNCLGSFTLKPLDLLCPSSLIPFHELRWPPQLLDANSDDKETE